jgi:sulfate adenylyltransferase subunit 1
MAVAEATLTDALPAPASDLLRLATAGSVDDGKSTLIGRLLYDSKSIFEDQLAHVRETSERRGDGYVNLALLTDGLRAEREQGITIDVAYRYFATPRRTFIIADTPGHEDYTRNMVTGASTADLALILVDARNGVVRQSRRHAVVASLLGIPHVVVCVNKMDLVDFREEAFEDVVEDFTAFAVKLDVTDITFVPASALHGDNVVERSARMPWYEGPPLLYHLEHVHIASDRNLADPRFPVQYVIRPMSDEHHDYRGYAGQVASGVLRTGDEVVILPAGRRSRIAAIETYDGPQPEAFPPQAVAVRLEDDLDVSRGDLLCRPHNRPAVTRDVEATLCWMSDAALTPGSRYVLKHTTRSVRAIVKKIRYRIDVESLARDEAAGELALNDIGRVHLRTSGPVMTDPYRENRVTGAFILIDEATNDTVGAGMVTAARAEDASGAQAAEARAWSLLLERLERAAEAGEEVEGAVRRALAELYNEDRLDGAK